MTNTDEIFRRALCDDELPLAQTTTAPSTSLPLHDPAVRSFVIATILGSTTARAQEVAAFVDRALVAKAGRAANAAHSAQKHKERVRRPIRAAIGALPQGNACKTATVAGRLARSPERYGIERQPCLDTIRDETRRAKIKPMTLLSSEPAPPTLFYASSSPSTST